MSRKRNHFTKIGMEALENRRLMTGDIDYSFSTKTLTISGDQLNDRVDVRFEGSNVKVDLYAQRSNGTFDHSDRTKSIGSVNKIVFNGFSGNDALNITQGNLNSGVTLANTRVEFNAAAGNDTMDNSASVVTTATGGDGNDSFVGGPLSDNLNGQAGNDSLYGRGGVDVILGGIGQDVIIGGDDVDYLYGEAGGDYLYGGLGNDWLMGGDDNDRLQGDAGDDVLYGENGADVFFGGLGNDWMGGGAGNDIMQGEQGNDTLYGNDGNDVMLGGTDNDKLYGNNGEDSLYGNDGNDILNGGYDGSLDYLVGGLGADTFYSKYVRKFSWFELTYETDWVGDFGAGDVIAKTYV
jgi:Ca2+-binding RTX toxin-like protein